jgi:hypothetical protein
MLTFTALTDLWSTLRNRTVLSVYINGEAHDPAKRRRWRMDLRHSLDDIAVWLKGSPHSDREAFAKSRRLLEEELAAYEGALGVPGWAGFITTDGVVHSDAVAAPVPTMAVWSTGPCFVPYVRAMKEARPVFVAVVDHRNARLYRYAYRVLKLVESFEAPSKDEAPLHMGTPARLGFHTGTHGRAGADEAQRRANAGTAHMLAQTVDRLAAYAASEAWIVIGGLPDVATALLQQLPIEFAHRSVRAQRLDVHATDAQIAQCARDSASAMREAHDLQRVTEAVHGTEASRRGVTGVLDARRALEARQVRELFFTLRFLENHTDDAEAAVRLALEQHALVEQVSGAAAESLDAVGGIAANLRYRDVAAVTAEVEGASAV